MDEEKHAGTRPTKPPKTTIEPPTETTNPDDVYELLNEDLKRAKDLIDKLLEDRMKKRD